MSSRADACISEYSHLGDVSAILGMAFQSPGGRDSALPDFVRNVEMSAMLSFVLDQLERELSVSRLLYYALSDASRTRLRRASVAIAADVSFVDSEMDVGDRYPCSSGNV